MLFLRKSIAKKLRSILYAFSKKITNKNLVQYYMLFLKNILAIFWLYLYLNNRVPAKNNPLNHPSFYVY